MIGGNSPVMLYEYIPLQKCQIEITKVVEGVRGLTASFPVQKFWLADRNVWALCLRYKVVPIEKQIAGRLNYYNK